MFKFVSMRNVTIHYCKSDISQFYRSFFRFQSSFCRLLRVSGCRVNNLCSRNLKVSFVVGKEVCGTAKNNVNKSFTRSLFYSETHDVNTNVIKDVLLYRYDRPKYYRVLNLFGISQYLFWTFLGHTVYTTLVDAPVVEQNNDSPWWKKINLGEQKYRIGITILCMVVGHVLLASTWVYTIKSIRYMVLRKGGNSVSIVTYTPTGHTRTITTELNKVSCTESRTTAKVHLPVKLKDYSLYFMLDMEGEFLNPKLFDRTVGLKRLL